MNKNLVILLTALLPVAPLPASANDAVISIQCTLTGTSGTQDTLPDSFNGTFNLWIYDVNAGGAGHGAVERVGDSSVDWINFVGVYPRTYAITLVNAPGIMGEDLTIDRNTGKGWFGMGRWINGHPQTTLSASYNCIKSDAPLPKHKL